MENSNFLVHFVLKGPENRGAVGAAEFETPKRRAERGMGRGYPLPTRLEGLGSVVSSPPQRDRKRIFVHFELEKNESGDDKFDFFCHFIAHI